MYVLYIGLLPELSPKNLKPRGLAAGAAAILIAAARLYRGDGPSKEHSCHHKANYGDDDAEEDDDELSTGDSSRSGISRHYRLRKKHKDLKKEKNQCLSAPVNSELLAFAPPPTHPSTSRCAAEFALPHRDSPQPAILTESNQSVAGIGKTSRQSSARMFRAAKVQGILVR